jgi:hypothetical protein
MAVGLQIINGDFIIGSDGTLNSDFTSIQTNSIDDKSFMVGAPFHFYFGLKKGKSAFDRFTTKWLDTTTTI